MMKNKQKKTNYIETSIDYQRYYTNCIFYSKFSNSILITSDKVSTTLEKYDEKIDEYIATECVISLHDIDRYAVINGIEVKEYSPEFKLIGTRIALPEEFICERKLFNSFTTEEGYPVFILFENYSTYKKGMNIDDYIIQFPADNPITLKERGPIYFWEKLLSTYSVPLKEVRKQYKEFINNRKIKHLKINNHYDIVRGKEYKYPVIFFNGSLVGYIENKKVYLELSGKTSNWLRSLSM